MLRNHLLVALRRAWRQKGLVLVNVAGLAVALAGCLVMGLFAWHELSYDRFHADADHIVRVVRETAEGSHAQTGGAFADLVRREVPTVERTVRVIPWERTLTVESGDEKAVFADPLFAYADPSFFDVFSFRLVAGDPASALAQPNTVVLTASAARTYFGEADPMGATVWMYDGYSDPNQIPLTVTGLLADPPQTSHLPLTAIASSATLEGQYGPLTQLGWPGLYTYALVQPGTDLAGAAQRATEALHARMDGDESPPTLRFQPLTSIYLNPADAGEVGRTGSKSMVYGLVLIALLVLLLACVNFTQIALSRAHTRVREAGIRQAVGASRADLARQFLVDASLLAAVALVGAVVLAVWALPYVSLFTGQPLTLAASAGGFVPLGIVLALGATSFLAAAYPALHVTRHGAVHALRGTRWPPGRFSRLRGGLVVLQLATSMLLVVGALVAYQQMVYVQTLPLGFDQSHVVTVEAGQARRAYTPLRDALAALPGVEAVSSANGLPGLHGGPSSMVALRGDAPGPPVATQGVAPDFFDLMDVPLLAGRIVDAPGSAAERPLVLNTSAAAALGWQPAEAIGQALRVVEPGNEANNPGLSGHVVGVVADFHHGSAHVPIPPAVYYGAQSVDVANLHVISHLLVRLAPGTAAATLGDLEATWKRLLPDAPFEAAFLDAQIEAQYVREQRLGRALGLFAGLALLIACLGLFGLASVATRQRLREIGVRKVLGATAPGLAARFTGAFAGLVGIAFVLAAPLAWWGLSRWLAGFAYHVALGPGVFALAGGLVLLMALVTVSVHTLRAATTDPVKVLRHE